MSGDVLVPVSSYRSSAEPVEEFELDAKDVMSAFSATAVRPLGKGAFGETWRVDLEDGRRAAKVLLQPDYSPARLEREVEGLRRVSSPFVVRLIDTIAVPVGGQTRSALLFEYIAGGDLGSRLKRDSMVPAGDVMRFGQGLLAGLEALHACETVHRDIKPPNIALRDGEWGSPVLLDLGLARVLDRASITSYPGFLGTAPYMAPEQLRMERARKAADVFAAGVVLHLMLAGEHPFYENQPASITLSEAIALIESGPAALPEEVPSDLAGVVRRLLSADEGDRGSARRAVRDLQACAEGHDDD